MEKLSLLITMSEECRTRFLIFKIKRKLKDIIENSANLTWRRSSCDCWNVYFSIQTCSFCCRLCLDLL